MRSQYLEKFDVVIIGAGPAGLSCALWCADLGMNHVLLEKSEKAGGQLLQIHNPIRNYLGIETENGGELLDVFAKQSAFQEINFRYESTVSASDLRRKEFHLSDGLKVQGRAAVIATGVRRRKLGIAGEKEFAGRGILESGAKERESVSGKHVVVVGGGDAALENAFILSKRAERVTIVHRRDLFTAREEFVRAVENNSKITIRKSCTPRKIFGSDLVEGVEVENVGGGEIETLQADAVLVRIGVVPNSGPFVPPLEPDERGYINVDSQGATSIPLVFAAGDVANPTSPTISTAVGTGATAAKSILSLLSPDK